MKRPTVKCFIVFAALLTGFLYYQVFHSSTFKLSSTSFDISSWTHEDIIGRAHDDPLLIKYIQSQLLLPSQLPYALKNPERKDFSRFNNTREIKKLFLTKRNGFFVEVGALDGELASNTLYWEREYGWTGLLIEANSQNFVQLIKKHRKAFALNACICPMNYANVVIFKRNSIGSSMVTTRNISNPRIMTCPCYPFYSIMAALGFPTVNFMSLDIEGWDMEVLRTFPLNILNIEVLMVEYIIITEGFDGLQKYLEDRGYHTRAKLNLDGVFVKKGVKFGLNMIKEQLQ